MEACLKFARRYWHSKGETTRTKYVAFSHAFHGRTMGALSVTWDDHYRAPFQPLIPNVVLVDNNAVPMPAGWAGERLVTTGESILTPGG